MPRSSETRTEGLARELVEVRGWKSAHPPKGNLLWKNEYRDYPHILEAFAGKGKQGRGGDAYPDFILVSADSIRPLIVGETKANDNDVDAAIKDAADIYGEALVEKGMGVLAAGVAGNDQSNIAIVIKKRSARLWKSIAYRGNPIQWIPTPEETGRLLQDAQLFDLAPHIPSPQILAKRADEINRIFRECSIKDEFRPASMGAFMLAVWHSKGALRMDEQTILGDINRACRDAFIKAGKPDLAESILVQEANAKLAGMAPRLCHILRVLGVTALTAEHDYLGQLYEEFFRFTGGNTIGQFFTPRHITRFASDLCEISRADYVVDPSCGTGGFLIAALYRMMGNKNLTRAQISKLVAKHLEGFEVEPVTAALCVANMILRGDGTTGVVKGDCFIHPDYPCEQASIVLGNPPFPHAGTDRPPEQFIDRGLEALRTRGKLAMIVPTKLLNAQGTKARWRKTTLENHSLRAVITFPAELFQPYASSTTALLVIEKGIPHDPKRPTFFCQVENDGLKLRKKVRLPIEGGQLPEAMSAYQTGDSVARFCVWDSLPILGNEWSPGAFIESLPLRPGELQAAIAWLLRGLVAFHSFRADRIYQLQQDIANGRCRPIPFREYMKGKVTHLGKRVGDIGTLFDVYYGQNELETKRGLVPGNVPVISSAGTQNGCFGFFDLSERTQTIQPPFVTVPRTGSIGESFVQLLPCGVTSDCLVLVPKADTPIEDLFIAAAMVRRERWRFNYGRKMTPTRISQIGLPRQKSLKAWVTSRLTQIRQLIRITLRNLGDAADGDREKFRFCVAEWKAGRGPSSKIRDLAMHGAYQQIIGMGEMAVPLLLEEMRDRPDQWTWALRAITGTDPVPRESKGKLREMAAAWVAWGTEQGYIE